MGERSERGFWYYFPATFALKTPLALMVLLALAARARAGVTRLARASSCFLWVPVAVYLALTLTRGLNIGHRHLLPIYPFLFVRGRPRGDAGVRGWRPLAGRGRRPAAAWYAVSVARVHPHYLAYFNEPAGGPANGYRLLVDSNLDWGQDLKGLAGLAARARHRAR